MLCLILVSCYGDPSTTTGPSDNNNTGDNGNGGNDTSPLVVTHFDTIDEYTKKVIKPQKKVKNPQKKAMNPLL